MADKKKLDINNPRDVVDNAWLKATADALEYDHDTSRALASGGPSESVKVCVIAAVIPDIVHEHYMDTMMAVHKELISKYPELISSRPDKTN